MGYCVSFLFYQWFILEEESSKTNERNSVNIYSCAWELLNMVLCCPGLWPYLGFIQRCIDGSTNSEMKGTLARLCDYSQPKSRAPWPRWFGHGPSGLPFGSAPDISISWLAYQYRPIFAYIGSPQGQVVLSIATRWVSVTFWNPHSSCMWQYVKISHHVIYTLKGNPMQRFVSWPEDEGFSQASNTIPTPPRWKWLTVTADRLQVEALLHAK